MRINQLHQWNLGLEQAKSIQKNLRAWLILEDQFSQIKHIARVKTQSIKGESMVKASVSLISYPELKIVEKQSASLQPDFPSQPGLISFRLSQVVAKALQELKKTPDLIICDGDGVIDEQRFGLASHIGLLAQKPCIGLRKPAKNLSLVESIENERGAWLPLTQTSDNQLLAAIVRVNKDVPVVQVSPGHAISVNSAVKFVLDCFPQRELPTQENVAIDINKARKKASA